MISSRGFVWLMVTVAMVCAASVSYAGDLENQARAVMDSYQKAVITVQLVIKQQYSMGGMGSQTEETKNEATGFVIDPSGLTVMSLNETDPSSMIENLMSNEEAQEAGFKTQSSLSDVKVLLDDGTEIPAKVVLRDKDLDLAYVRPVTAPPSPLTAVDLKNAGEPAIADPIVALNRLGKVAGRTIAVSLERIEAIIRKPRTLFVPGNDPTHSALGSPVFTMDGKIIGMIALRSIKTEGGSGFGGMLGGMGESMLGVVIPAGAILEGAAQAPAADKVPDEPPLPAPTEEAPTAGDTIQIPAAPAAPGGQN